MKIHNPLLKSFLFLTLTATISITGYAMAAETAENQEPQAETEI